MSVFPCSACRQRKPGKLASAYWAWFLADNSRSAWKVRYCSSCAPEYIGKILNAVAELENADKPFNCVSCGKDSKDDADPIYLTVYLPGREPLEYAIQLCGSCAAKVRGPIVDQGERLPDRGGEVGGPPPPTSAWDAIGLTSSR